TPTQRDSTKPGKTEPAKTPPGNVQAATPSASSFQPPVLTKPAGGIVTRNPGSVTLEWSRVPDAVEYQIETRDSDLANKRLVGTTKENRLQVPFTGETFSVRIIAINAKGETASMQWTPIRRQEVPKPRLSSSAPPSTPVTNH